MLLIVIKIYLIILLQAPSSGFSEKLKNEIVNYLTKKFSDRQVEYLVELKSKFTNFGNFENCDVKVIQGPDDFRGYQTFKVKVSGKDGSKEFFVSALLRTFENVVVARRDLNRGEVVDSVRVFDLFSFERIETTFLKDGYLCNVSGVYGKKLKKAVRRGEIVFESYFDVLPLVKGGETVRVIAKVGNVKVETMGIARSDGHLNEIIMVVNPRSGKLFPGKVVRKGVVAVEIEN